MKPSKNSKIVLIDDDELVFATWQYVANNNGLDFFYFKSIEDFMCEKYKFDTDTLLFIDSNLGNGDKGEISSKKILNAGFSKIYISTGDKNLEKPDWVIKVLNKSFPFEVCFE